MRRSAAACAALWLAACLPSVDPIVSCQARGPAKPLCGYQNPEDLVALPGGQALLVSEYGGMDSGNLFVGSFAGDRILRVALGRL